MVENAEPIISVQSQRLTSLISFILEPPFPMREPHWLAGMTNRKVTGGLLVTVPLATKAVRSLERDKQMHLHSQVFKILKIFQSV